MESQANTKETSFNDYVHVASSSSSSSSSSNNDTDNTTAAATVTFDPSPTFECVVDYSEIPPLTSADPRKQPKFTRHIGSWTMKKAAQFYHMRVFVEDKAALEALHPAIFGLEPHGVLPLGICAFYPTQTGFANHRAQGCVTGICFKIPLMKHVYTWMSAASVDKKQLIRSLDRKFSPIICPGGVQECTHLATNRKECVLFLKKRAGFVKLALKYGYPLVPVFTFGLHNLFSFYVPKSRLLTKIGRKIGFLPMIFFGAFGLPFGPGKPCDLVNVIGKPIPVPHIPNPTDEDVQKYHEMFLSEMDRVYNTYRHRFGMGDRTLRII
eukprot:scaffold879_cov170-Ochromonas_danica.AAC.18